MNDHPISPSRFTDVLVHENELYKNGFTNWILHEGMEFGTCRTWWGSRKDRSDAHEGVDLCFYSGDNGNIFQLLPGTRIPSTHNGVVRKIFDDFLGKTIVLEHATQEMPDRVFLSMYGHVGPVKKLEISANVHEGDIIAGLSSGNTSGIPQPHLHLTFAYVLKPFNYDALNWSFIGNTDVIRLIDPQSIIGLQRFHLI